MQAIAKLTVAIFFLSYFFVNVSAEIFGITTVGASTDYWNARINGACYTATEDGVAINLTYYTATSTSGHCFNMTVALYNKTGTTYYLMSVANEFRLMDNNHACSSENTVTTWHSWNLKDNVSVYNNSVYCIAVIDNQTAGGVYHRWAYAASGVSFYKSNTFPAFPNPLSAVTAGTQKKSGYIGYYVEATSSTSSSSSSSTTSSETTSETTSSSTTSSETTSSSSSSSSTSSETTSSSSSSSSSSTSSSSSDTYDCNNISAIITYPRFNQSFYFPSITPNVTVSVDSIDMNLSCQYNVGGAWNNFTHCNVGENATFDLITLPAGEITIQVNVTNNCTSVVNQTMVHVYYKQGIRNAAYSRVFIITFLVMLALVIYAAKLKNDGKL